MLRGARWGEKRLVEGEEEKTKHACRVACPARLYSICTMPLWYSSISASSSFLLRPPQITSLPCRHAPSSSPRPRIPLPSPSHPCPRPLHSLPQSTSSQIIAARDEAEPRIGLDIFIHPSPALITGASSPTSMPPACRDIQKNFSVLSPSIYGILSIYFQGNLYQVRFCNNVICTMWYHLQELINLKFVFPVYRHQDPTVLGVWQTVISGATFPRPGAKECTSLDGSRRGSILAAEPEAAGVALFQF